ncbi:MAG: polymerase, sigma-24 subunit, subfamily [Fluviicola sp.]|jgi:RNA polymerase sigma-70 factor (ECF subfamily)|uniref:RNA polymerase sigma factor n=1 Tax=Fluviicola sp. TaxID=1917219 RepID=UPI0026345493|nr:RNA polymerase sigma factor [Fluviicola sp.]MDF3028807.1 polymerase, sigma-24 subunit, subfamily [Fluviicola sp.]
MTLELLYEKHAKQVYNLVLQYVQNVNDAEEITQDVFLAAYKSLDKFRNESNHSTWLYRIAINKSLDFLKAKRRKKRFFWFTNELTENDSVEFNHPGVLIENKEETAFIFSCMDQLPDNQKTALILNKIEQLPVMEIAGIMGLSAKAVESLIQRAKINLSKKIEDSEG